MTTVRSSFDFFTDSPRALYAVRLDVPRGGE